MCHRKTEQEDRQAERWEQAGGRKECGAVGYPEMLSNADHLLVSVPTQVLLALLVKMEILATPDIRAVLPTVSSTSFSGDVCSQQG